MRRKGFHEDIHGCFNIRIQVLVGRSGVEQEEYGGVQSGVKEEREGGKKGRRED